jgi:hypothetical protein
MARQEQRATGNTGDHEILGGNQHVRSTGCTYESTRRLEGALDKLPNARVAGPRVEG